MKHFTGNTDFSGLLVSEKSVDFDVFSRVFAWELNSFPRDFSHCFLNGLRLFSMMVRRWDDLEAILALLGVVES